MSFHYISKTILRFANIRRNFGLKYSTMGEHNDALFKGDMDRFHGITVESVKEPRTDQELVNSIEDSIRYWKGTKVRAVWFKVYLKDSHWIPILAKNLFVFHHAKPDYVSMVRWLPENEENSVPYYAHTTIGVGGFVVNENDEVLVVRERSMPFPHWKLPGGYVDPGEEFAEAVCREVNEETGIDTEFVSVLSFRHTHDMNLDCSDLYFVMLLKPLHSKITICEKEIVDAQWMKLDTFLHHEYVNSVNQHFGHCYKEAKENGYQIKCSNHELQFSRFRRNVALYNMKSIKDSGGSGI